MKSQPVILLNDDNDIKFLLKNGYVEKDNSLFDDNSFFGFKLYVLSKKALKIFRKNKTNYEKTNSGNK
jgi:hypothetical protein